MHVHALLGVRLSTHHLGVIALSGLQRRSGHSQLLWSWLNGPSRLRRGRAVHSSQYRTLVGSATDRLGYVYVHSCNRALGLGRPGDGVARGS